jgi:hypothetical protein
MNMKTLALTAAVLIAITASARAAEEFDAAAAARVVAPFVERETIAVVHIDFARVKVEPLIALLGRVAPDQKDEWARAEGAANGFINLVRGTGVTDVYAVATLGGKSMFPQAFLVVPDSKQLNVLALRAVWNIGGQQGDRAGSQGRKVGNAYVLPLTTHLPPVPEEFHPADRPELREALAAAGKTPVQVVLIPPDSSRRVIEETLPQLPREIGGGPSTVFTHGISWAAASVDLAPTLSSRLMIKSQDAQAAVALRAKWIELLNLGRKNDVGRALPDYEKLASTLTPKQSGDRLTLELDEKEMETSGLMAALQLAAQKARGAAGRAQSMNNLKQLALAMYNYSDVAKHFPPPANRGPDGKPLLSWRVAILPYIEQGQLYNQFHLNEPWDSPHNKALIGKMPALFRLPSSKAAPGMTNYVVPVGGGALYSSTGEEPTLKDISDGTSNTIMLVGVDDKHAVIWTKPDDMPFDPQDPKKGIGSVYREGFPAAFCDGSVRILRSTIDPTTLKALFTRAGGEVIGEY